MHTAASSLFRLLLNDRILVTAHQTVEGTLQDKTEAKADRPATAVKQADHAERKKA